MSDFSDLSEESDCEELQRTRFTDYEDESQGLEDEEENLPLSLIQKNKQAIADLDGDELEANQNQDKITSSKKHSYRWCKKHTWLKPHSFFVQPFRATISRNDPIPVFKQISPDKIITDSVEQANIYNCQTKQKKYQGSRSRVKITDRSNDKNGGCFFALLQVLQHTGIQYYSVTDVMLRNRFQFKKTCTLPITMKWTRMKNLQSLDQSLILSVINALRLN